MTGMIAAVTVAHLTLIVLLFAGSRYRTDTTPWAAAVIASITLAALSYMLPDQSEATPGRGTALTAVVITAVIAFGIIPIRDLTSPAVRQARSRRWFVAGAAWLIAFIVAAVVGEQTQAGQDAWLIRLLTNPDPSLIVFSVGFTLFTLVLVGFTFTVFFRARLPEIANRALFWAINLVALSPGLLGLSTGNDVIAAIGLVLTTTALTGTIYAVHHHHVFDIRGSLILALRSATFVGIGGVLVFLVVVITLEGGLTRDVDGFMTIGLIALLAAAAFVPLRQGINHLVDRLTARPEDNPSLVTREYSVLVAEVTELEQLIPSVTAKLTRLLNVESAAVILLNQITSDSLSMIVREPASNHDQRRGEVSINTALYIQLARERRPLLQFDIEFDPRFRDVPLADRQFFRSLGKSAYAPIAPDFTMIGILAVGPRNDDVAFFSRDLQLLDSLAQQTGMALRNARLVEDLQHLNRSMRNLNTKLKSTNEQLQTMDSVKTDFVTIASHELRTPLAQVRGYTDILDALNDQGMLDPDQTRNLINNLRKASERMEELISAMLDVSQLDVDAMDLRFTPTSIESVMRMAIEPLTDAIRQRKITLSARGLRGLPTIQADLQRLVQAFRNVIVNAIKFTPDGGRIDINAALESNHDTAEAKAEHILITIRDTGVGIDPNNLEMIFKKFFRAYNPSLHSTGTYKFLGAGPGLGLTIARGVIEGHGGRIWAESSGHDMNAMPGSIFTIELPVTTAEVGEKRVLSFEGPAAQDAISQPPGQRRATMPRRPTPSTDQEP